MSENEETTQLTPLASLGESLNYQPEILEKLLAKKQRLLSFNDLKKMLADLSLKDLGNTPKPPKMEDALTSFKEKTDQVLATIKGLPTESKVEGITEVDNSLKKLLEDTESTLSLVADAKTAEPDNEDALPNAQKAFNTIVNGLSPLQALPKVIDESIQTEEDLALDEAEIVADHFLGSLATALFNDILPNDKDDPESTPLSIIRHKVDTLTTQIDKQLHADLNAIIHDEKFKSMEANWVGLDNLIATTDWSADIMIDMLDCTKHEVGEDLENNANGLINSELFKKVYVGEYDQFGGLPYGAIIGLYEFENTRDDRAWLTTMGQLSNACHAPFFSSVGPKFFGCKNIDEMAEIRDLEAHMSHPRFERWQAMRDSDEAAYIGLTLPRFMLRPPYHPENYPAGAGLSYEEEVRTHKGGEDFLWCNASLLFAKNMIESFIHSGWCQYIRGPKGGGKIEHLPRYAFNLNGQEEIKAPIEMVIPDYREYAFAKAGFIPLVYRKGSADACFFSSQSIKKPKDLKNPQDTENSQLVTNLSYTLSITRIAHYVKCIMRDNIGSAADGAYINNVLQTWLSRYVTTVVNPDDLTLRYYPFKAAEVVTTPQEGMIGWYNSEITILPHIQFEGLDVELKMDVRI